MTIIYHWRSKDTGVFLRLKNCKFNLYLRLFFMFNIYCKRHLVNSFLGSTDETIFNWQTSAIVTKRLLAFIHEINRIKENHLIYHGALISCILWNLRLDLNSLFWSLPIVNKYACELCIYKAEIRHFLLWGFEFCEKGIKPECQKMEESIRHVLSLTRIRMIM